jgi:cytosine/adenosine deaminase-related metal-dependent hydrolase
MRHPNAVVALLCAFALLSPAACGPSASTPPPSDPRPSKATSAPPTSPPALGDAAPRVVKRTVIMQTRRSGSSVTKILPDGSLELAYEHFQNGRGPKVEARARIAADGTLASFEAKGKHTMGNVIEESFAVEGTRARWKSREEQGEKALAGPAFYMPIASLPEMFGALFAALRKNGGRIALLPEGEARLEQAATTNVRAGGREKRLIAWVITGIDFTPSRLFTEEDGTFFGVVDPWYSYVPEGWEEVIDPLIELQKRLDAARDREIADRVARRPPAAGLAFTGARVLDVEKKRWLADHTLVVVGDKITALGPTKTTKPPAGAEVKDLAGKAILPGLWDMHAHLGQADGALNIASGVTTVRDLGNNPDRLDDFKKRFDEMSAIGPRVLRSGFIEGRGEKAAASEVTAETKEEAAAAVEFYAKRGYEGIKIYNSMKPELVPLLAQLAHAKGMRVSGHVPMSMRAEDTVRAGYDEIQHVNMLFLNFFIDKDTDTRTPLRFSIVAEKGPSLDLQSKPVRDFFKLLIDKKIVVDPTVGVFEELFVGRPGQPPPGFLPMIERLPVQVQRAFRTGGLVVPEGKDETYKQAFVKALEMIKALYDAKIPIVAGTDSIAGLMLHYELELYVKAGIPSGDVLELATLGSARIMKKDKTTGSLARGKDADFFVVDGDPLARIQDLRKVTSVVRGGVVISAADLHATVGVRP